MRIAFLPIYTQAYQKNKIFLGHTSMAYIMSYLEQYYPDDLIYPVPDIDFLMRTGPDLLAISAPYSESFSSVIEVAKKVKEVLKIPIVIGGQHISGLPNLLPDCIDVGVIGEGEETFRDLITIWKDFEAFPVKELSKTKGIVYKDNNRKIVTPPQKVIENIDEIPMSRKFFPEIPGTWTSSISTGRGTRFRNVYETKSVSSEIRLHSAERLISDIVDQITFYPKQKTINIVDEFFFYDKQRMYDTIKIIDEAKINQKYKFNLTARPIDIDEEVCYILKFGLKSLILLNITMMSPNQLIQKEIRETSVTIKQQREVLDLCYKYNIPMNIQWLIGTPNETKESLAKDYWLIKKYSKDYKEFNFSVNPFVVFPDTSLWKQASMKKLVSEKMNNWEEVFNIENISQKTPILNNLHLKGDFLKVFSKFKEIDKISTDKVFEYAERKKEFVLNVTTESILEHIIKMPNLKSILQITDEKVFNIEKLFSEDSLDIGHLNIWKILNGKYPKMEKSYDCILLFFSLDVVKSPKSLIQFCKNNLNKNGKILLIFYNALDGINIKHLVFPGFDIQENFHRFDRRNFFTYKSMKDLIEGENMIINKFKTVYSIHENSRLAYFTNILNTIRSFSDKIEELNQLFLDKIYMLSASKVD